MSDSNKRDEGMQDYMDLLEEMSRKDSENAEKMPSPPPIKDTQTEKTEFEDIKSSSEKEKNPFKRLSRWYNNLPKKKKIVVSIVAVFLAFVIVITTALGIFIGKKFGLLGDNINSLEYDDTIYEEYEIRTLCPNVTYLGRENSQELKLSLDYILKDAASTTERTVNYFTLSPDAITFDEELITGLKASDGVILKVNLGETTVSEVNEALYNLNKLGIKIVGSTV